MSELAKQIDVLLRRLNALGLRVEQAAQDALEATRRLDVDAGKAVDERDAEVDREEVAIEQECIRQLALYQPAAIDLRTICTIIKVNSDLERIADLASGIGRRVKRMVAEGASVGGDADFNEVAGITLELLKKTIDSLVDPQIDLAREVMESDKQINQAYKRFVRGVPERERTKEGGADRAITLFMLAKTLERIGDHCTNIAEDIIFWRTGEIVRHLRTTTEQR